MSEWTDQEAEADLKKQMSHTCVNDGDHTLCPCVVMHARGVMRYWTGTNCTWVDDDITALGILAGMAIKAGLYKTTTAIPETMISEIDRKLSTHSAVFRDTD